jgi:hypothetical protein
MAPQASSWQAEVRKLAFLYFVAGMASIPWWTGYGILVVKGLNNSLLTITFTVGSLLTAIFVWDRVESRMNALRHCESLPVVLWLRW